MKVEELDQFMLSFQKCEFGLQPSAISVKQRNVIFFNFIITAILP